MNALLLSMALAAAPVSEVVVYPDRAQVVRTTRVACGPNSTATFEGITPAAERGSFQASATGAQVLGLTATERTLEQAFSAERAKLEGQRRTLDQELAALNDAIHREGEQRRLSRRLAEIALERIGHEMVGARPDRRSWNAAFDVPLQVQLRAAERVAGLQLEVHRKQLRRAELERELQRLQLASQRRELVVEAQVACARGEATVSLTYLVGGATWQPGYEARANEGAGQVELSTFATVKQATGEDWTNARLVLSTATPAQAATPPEIRPLRIGVYKEPEKKVLVRRDEERKHAEAGAVSDTAVQGALQAVSQGISVQLVVPEKATVKGDGTAVRLFVARQPMKASFGYRAIPKLFPGFFRSAALTNTGAFPLLPGTIDVYRRQALVSRYPLEWTARGARFELSFGMDEALRAERQVVEEVQRQTGLFGTNRRFRYAYRIEIANLHDRKETLEISEPVPVSEIDEVKVELDEKTTRGFEHKKDDGVVTWKFDLGAKQKKAIDLVFHVDVPSSWDTGGL